MNATELFLSDHRPAGIFFCGECRIARDKKQEQERFEKAVKIPFADYDGPIMIPDSDIFFASVSDMLDEIDGEEIPAQLAVPYVWACTQRPVCHLNYSDIIENATQDAYEDFDPEDLDGRKELEQAIEQFNEKNEAKTVWEPDYSRAVLIPQLTNPIS